MRRGLVGAIGLAAVSLAFAACGGSSESSGRPDLSDGAELSSASGSPTAVAGVVVPTVSGVTSGAGSTAVPTCPSAPASVTEFPLSREPGLPPVSLDAVSTSVGVLCRYGDADGGYTVIGSAALDAADVASIAAALKRLQPRGVDDYATMQLYSQHDVLLLATPAGQVRLDVMYGGTIVISAVDSRTDAYYPIEFTRLLDDLLARGP
jgi:hypothetical protein